MANTSASTPRGLGDKDAPHVTPVTPAEDVRTVLINRISWGAVFAGAVIALVTQLLLNMLGLGIGAATFDPATGESPTAAGFSVGAAMWWTVSGVIAAFLGGLTAGRLSGRPKESTAGWHGLISWAATTLVVVVLLTSAIGSIIGGAFSALTNAVGGLGSTVAQTSGSAIGDVSDPFAAIERQIRERAGGTDPQALRDAAVASMRAALTGDQAQAQQARDRAAEALAQAQNISVEDARAQIDQYEAEYRQNVEQAKQQAVQAAEATAEATSRGAIFGFVALLLGAIAAWFGGRAGAVDPTMTEDAEIIRARRQV